MLVSPVATMGIDRGARGLQQGLNAERLARDSLAPDVVRFEIVASCI
ncbi:MAG: hypothetical protein JXO72_11835 [Vicinamibacteria bacterium]|nr:hypothetical protein [Vicinamibacteria bacterium]